MFRSIYPVIGSSAELPFYLTGAGIAEPEYHCRRDSGLVSHQFLFTVSGEGILTVGGQLYPQKPNGIFYLPPGVPHEYRPAETEWTTHWLVFRGDNAAPIMEKLGFTGFLNRADADLTECESIFDRLLAAAGEPLSGAERCSLLIYEFILAARTAMTERGGDLRAAGRVIHNAVKYMETHYMEDIPLERLASMSGVSLQHFCRVFRSRMGMRPMEYLARRRIAEAKNLLGGTDMSVRDIAAAVGYPDQTYFGMVFKKYEGITPTDYRRGGACGHE